MLGHHCPKSCFLAGNECLLEGARGGQALAGCTASRVWKAESPKVCIKAGPSLLQPRERRLGEKGREHSPPPKDVERATAIAALADYLWQSSCDWRRSVIRGFGNSADCLLSIKPEQGALKEVGAK